MMDMITVTAKNVEEAIMQASMQLGVSSDRLQYEVVEKGSVGILGGLIGAKPAVIRAKKIETIDEKAADFLHDVFGAMGISVDVESKLNEEEKELDINLSGDEMGILIGKRGQTLDSLQYLVSLVVNKESEDYLRVKLDTENYRERRIIHSALQNDKYVFTRSEGEEPFRHVVIALKREERTERRRPRAPRRDYSKSSQTQE